MKIKTAYQILAYLTVLFLVFAIAFKLNHYSGEHIVVMIAGTLVILYFPVYILHNGIKMNGGKIKTLDFALALTLFFITLGVCLKLNHQELGSLFILIGLGVFCFFYTSALYYKKSRETNANNLMWAIGSCGIAFFPLAIFCKVYLGLDWGMQLFTLGAILLFVVFLPFYLHDPNLSIEDRARRYEAIYFPIILGLLLFFCVFKSVYPSHNEMLNEKVPNVIESNQVN